MKILVMMRVCALTLVALAFSAPRMSQAESGLDRVIWDHRAKVADFERQLQLRELSEIRRNQMARQHVESRQKLEAQAERFRQAYVQDKRLRDEQLLARRERAYQAEQEKVALLREQQRQAFVNQRSRIERALSGERQIDAARELGL